jgi:hypothetical protein
MQNLPFDELYNFIKVWTPIISAGTFLYATYRSGKKSVTLWAHKLLDNHLDHAQKSLDRIEDTQRQQLEVLRQIAAK